MVSIMEKPNSREGLTSWILTAGDDRITRNRVFIYAAVVAEAHSVFICIFIRVWTFLFLTAKVISRVLCQ